MSLLKLLLNEASILDQNKFFKDIFEKDITWQSGEDKAFMYLKSLISSYLKGDIKVSSVYKEFKKNCGVNLKNMDFFRVLLKELENPYKIDDFLTILNNIEIFSQRIYKNLSDEEKDIVIDGNVSYQDICKKIYTLYDKFKIEENFIQKQKDKQWVKVYENRKWVAIYPKTQKAFIEWSTTLSNGKKESYSKGQEDARVAWCTSRREANNEWRNYTKTSACFILIKKTQTKIPSNRKIEEDIQNLLLSNPEFNETEARSLYFSKLKKVKEENEYLQTNGYNTKDVYRRISYKVNVKSGDTSLYPEDTIEAFRRKKSLAEFKYHYDADVSNVESETTTMSVNADNCYMTLSKLSDNVDSDVLDACKAYTKENFDVENTPLKLYYNSISKEEIKEVILISIMFHNKMPSISDVVFDYIEISEFITKYIENVSIEKALNSFEYIISDVSLVETDGFIPLINRIFEKYDTSECYSHIFDLILNKKDLSNYQTIVCGITLKIGIDKMSANNIFNLKDINSTVLSKFFNHNREKLYEIYEYACDSLSKEDIDWIFSFICNYNSINISNEELEHLDYFEYILDSGINNHITDYIVWLVLVYKAKNSVSIDDAIKQIGSFIDESYDFDEIKDNFSIATNTLESGQSKDVVSKRIINNIDFEDIILSEELLHQVLPLDITISDNPISNNEISQQEITMLLNSIDKAYSNNKIKFFDMFVLNSILNVIVLSNNILNVDILCNIALNNPKFMINFAQSSTIRFVHKFLKWLKTKNSDTVKRFLKKLDEYNSELQRLKDRDYTAIVRKREKRDKEYIEQTN